LFFSLVVPEAFLSSGRLCRFVHPSQRWSPLLGFFLRLLWPDSFLPISPPLPDTPSSRVSLSQYFFVFLDISDCAVNWSRLLATLPWIVGRFSTNPRLRPDLTSGPQLFFSLRQVLSLSVFFVLGFEFKAEGMFLCQLDGPRF